MMSFTKIIQLLAVLATSLQLSNAQCGQELQVGFLGDNCGSDQSASNAASRILYDAMMAALTAATGETIDVPYEAFVQDRTNNGNGNGGNANGNGNTRHLELDEDFLRDVVPAEHRELQSCGLYCSCCGASWCCRICGHGCRRSLMVEAMKTAALRSGRSLQDLKEQVCANVVTELATRKGNGCLKDATVATCELIEATRTDETVVEQDQPQETLASGTSGAAALNNLLVPALVGLAAIMA